MIVVGCQIDRSEAPAGEPLGPGLAREQLGQAVAAALGLQQQVRVERAAFAYGAVDRRCDGGRVGGDGPGAGRELAREELVEAAVGVGVDLAGLRHVDRKQP